ncbi:hypothetical protein SLS53_000822 [Cytospora paraplurivora]|uniref:Carbohydrate kinase PfkB domain-containing protein n=1 Tax=Cytospora paraplurivora TaxID=2898453 RepID=A0AAN9UJT1_9PEZI
MTPAPRLYDLLPHALLGLTTLFSFLYLHQAKKTRPSWLLHLLDNLVKRAQGADEGPNADLHPEDEIEYQPPKPPQKDILGGAGSYAALGARLLSPTPAQSKAVGWIVDRGSDFPPAVTTLIDSWDTTAVFRDDPERLTTRGWNGYVDGNETRAFRYTTPKKRLVAADLSGTSLLQSRTFHIICSPSRCRELVTDLLTLRKDEAPPEEGGYTRPIIIWEPVPDLCTPDELLNLTNCLPIVDVCSPNHSELAGFLGDTGVDPETGAISTAAVEQGCEQLLGSMPLSSFTLVVRAGEKGCYVARNGGRGASGRQQSGSGTGARRQVGPHGGLQPDTDMMSLFAGLLQKQQQSTGEGEGEDEDEDWEEDDGDGDEDEDEDEDDNNDDEDDMEIDPGLDRWIPAYFTKETQDSVIDPTGGGNTFLGGLAVALARGKGMEEAATWASVAASFAIEQVGVPELGRDEEGEETWNGVRVSHRLSEFQQRIGMSPT